MKSRVRFTPAADRDVSRIDEWWRSNRPGSPALFASELRRFVALLRESPSIGVSYVGSKVRASAGTRSTGPAISSTTLATLQLGL